MHPVGPMTARPSTQTLEQRRSRPPPCPRCHRRCLSIPRLGARTQRRGMRLLVVNLLRIWLCTCLMLCTVGRYFVLNFRISTVFDIILLELVRFRNSKYSVSSCLFSCLACPLSLSLSYFKCKSRKRLRSFSTEFSTVFILGPILPPLYYF